MILKNIRYLVTQNPSREILENHDLEVDSGEIKQISPNITDGKGPVIDCSNRAVLPGLINGHTHSPMTLLRGISDDKPLQRWLEEDIFPAEDSLSRRDVYRGALLGCKEMANTGTTAFNDMYFHMDAVAEAVEESGMRAVLSHGMVDIEGNSYTEIADAVKAAEKNREKKRVRSGVSPHSVYTCSEELLIEAKKLAENEDQLFHVHVSETKDENTKHMEKYGSTPVEYMDDLGLIDSDTVIAHGTHLSEKDMRIIAEREASVVHNPSANLKLGSGVANVPEMLKRNINAALGTDGPASNNSLNMFDEAKIAALIQKKSEPSSITAQQILDMMTINGAEALNMEEQIGSLEEGKKADIIMVDLGRPDMRPFEKDNIVSNLIYSFNGEVSEVFVDGIPVKRSSRNSLR